MHFDAVQQRLGGLSLFLKPHRPHPPTKHTHTITPHTHTPKTLHTLSHTHSHLTHTRDTTELLLISVAAAPPANQGGSSGVVLRRVASHPLVDVSGVVFEQNDRQPDAFAFDYHTPVWTFTSSKDQEEWNRLEAWRPNEVATPTSRSRDKQVCGGVSVVCVFWRGRGYVMKLILSHCCVNHLTGHIHRAWHT